MAKQADRFRRGEYVYMRLQVVGYDHAQNGSPMGDVVVATPVSNNGDAMPEHHYVREGSLITPKEAMERILNRRA